MDYDNFRQMVLGADIKPMRSSELMDISKKAVKETSNKDIVDNIFYNNNKNNNIITTVHNNNNSIMNKKYNKENDNINTVTDILDKNDYKKYIKILLKEYKNKDNTAITYLTNIIDTMNKSTDFNCIFTLDFEIEDFIIIINYFQNCVDDINTETYNKIVLFLNNISNIKRFNVFKSLLRSNDIYLLKLLFKKMENNGIDVLNIRKKFIT